MSPEIYETPTYERRDIGTPERNTQFKAISWGAIFGGLAGGMAVYLLLALLGIAVGLSAVDMQAAEPAGRVPLGAAIWTGLSMLISAFVGGFVAARMSGFSRKTDGLLHGMVAWGISTLVFAFILTTSAGALIGGAFSLVGKGAKAVAGGVAATAGGAAQSGAASGGQLESLLKGSAGGGGEIDKESMTALQQRISAGDRDGAVDVMVNQMGFTRERASQVADKAMALSGSARNLPEQAREVAGTAVSGLSKVSWALFAAMFLSMILGLSGGLIGAKAGGRRRHPLAHT